MNVTIDKLSCNAGSPIQISNIQIKMQGCDTKTSICANESGTFQADFSYNELTEESVLMNVEVQLGGSYYELWFDKKLDFCAEENGEMICAFNGTEHRSFEFEGSGGSGNQDWLYYSGFAHPIYLRFYEAYNQTTQLGYCRGRLPTTSVSTLSLSNFVVPIMFFSLSLTFLVVVPLVRTAIQRRASDKEEKLLQCQLNLGGKKKSRSRKGSRGGSKSGRSRRHRRDESDSSYGYY